MTRKVRCSPAPDAKPAIGTSGEIFPSGAILEPIRDPSNSGRLHLLLWQHGKATSGPRLNYQGQLYEPERIDSTIVRALALPDHIAPFGSARELLHEIGELINQYCGLPERFVSETSRFVLATHFADATPSAPSLSIVGPETIAADQLFQLLCALCRHALPVSTLRFSAICSLPTRWRLTLLIRQRHFDRALERLLSAAHKRGEFVPHRGRLLELHGAVVTYTAFEGARELSRAILRIPSVQNESPLLKLRQATVERIRSDFGPRLLAYRLENHAKILHSQFDTPTLADPVRELACCLGACTPDDADLQNEVARLLQHRNAEHLSRRRTDFDAIIAEVLLVYSHERLGGEVYVGEIARDVEAILEGRGERMRVTPHKVGGVLDDLGLQREDRNARGYRLVLTGALPRHIHEVARQLCVLPFADGVERCELCRTAASGRTAAGN